jgi:hypothetical protein
MIIFSVKSIVYKFIFDLHGLIYEEYTTSSRAYSYFALRALAPLFLYNHPQVPHIFTIIVQAS